MQQVLADKVKLIVTDSHLAFMQGRYEESLRLAKQALDMDRKNSDAHQCAGNAYMSREDYESAIKAYKKAVEYDADNGGSIYTKADVSRYRQSNGLTWHELNDGKHMHLVPTEINAEFTHVGGVGEINAGAYAPGGFATK